MAVGRKVNLVRERIDLGENPLRSIIHKVWEDGTEETFFVRDDGILAATKEEWDQACKDHVSHPVWANSAYGDRLTDEQESEFKASGLTIDQWLDSKGVL